MNSAGFHESQVGALLEPVGRHAVDDAEIHRLRRAPHGSRNPVHRNVEELAGGKGVNILFVAESSAKFFVLAQVRQHAQVDLRVVGGKQDLVGSTRHERLANLPSFIGANGNVLQVGIVRREPTRGGAGLLE